MMRLLDLYRHTDPELARALEGRMGLAAMARAGGIGRDAAKPATAGSCAGPAAQVRAYFAEAAGTAARFLARPDGPRVGALGFNGWDTHINEGAAQRPAGHRCSARSTARIAAIETNMGDAWRETVVAVITEFGRTARINGTEGTDHGTGTVALLLGGALKGGRVIADWPGLKDADLYERPRSQAHHRSARRAQGRAARSPARRATRAGRARVPWEQRREADGGFVGLAAWDHLLPRTGCPVFPIRTSISRRDQPVSVARFWASCVKRAGSAAR